MMHNPISRYHRTAPLLPGPVRSQQPTVDQTAAPMKAAWHLATIRHFLSKASPMLQSPESGVRKRPGRYGSLAEREGCPDSPLKAEEILFLPRTTAPCVLRLFPPSRRICGRIRRIGEPVRHRARRPDENFSRGCGRALADLARRRDACNAGAFSSRRLQQPDLLAGVYNVGQQASIVPWTSAERAHLSTHTRASTSRSRPQVAHEITHARGH